MRALQTGDLLLWTVVYSLLIIMLEPAPGVGGIRNEITSSRDYILSYYCPAYPALTMGMLSPDLTGPVCGCLVGPYALYKDRASPKLVTNRAVGIAARHSAAI